VELGLQANSTAGTAGVAVQDLVTILGNLLDNAIDAAADAPAPKWVELSVDSGGRGVEITVQDSGRGIDPGAVDDVFRHGFSTKTPGKYGRGLGLALVRQAVHRLGGTMTITNPRGAHFHIFLPAATTSATGSDAVPRAIPGAVPGNAAGPTKEPK
jgi:sensor histidine kinase regulating citrate/malate metabolism